MLSHLSVRDFAIVESVDLEFDAGMTVLTGETGAGKSILVDALSLAVGERANADFVRPGAQRADITAVFELENYQPGRDWLAAQSLDDAHGECILRRTVASDGRSKAFINARPVPVQTLRALGDLLVDIHGQHEHQSVLKRDAQRLLIDGFADHPGLLEQVETLSREWHALQAELEALSGSNGDHDARLELLRYQIEELSQFAPVAGELQSLSQELKRLDNITAMTETCARVLDQLTGSSAPSASVLSALQSGSRELDDLPDDDPRLLGAAELLESAAIALQEAVGDLRSYAETLTPDPARMAVIESRLSTAHDLGRKHKLPADELCDALSRLQADVECMEGTRQQVADLTKRAEDVRERYTAAASKLHRSRTGAAKSLSGAVVKQLGVLGMPGSTFDISIEKESVESPRDTGTDRVEFLVATNPGQAPLPLARVASGGELSRISLALQVVTTGGTGVPTVIFDEIDVGIGGKVAEVIGQHMHALGGSRQVLCVTHLPQVASQADAHVQVQKKTSRKRVKTQFEQLAGAGRVEEIARMLGGLEITAQTRAHAREMLGRS